MNIENSKVAVSVTDEQWQAYLDKAGNEVDARGRILSDAMQQLEYEKEAQLLTERQKFIDRKLAGYTKLHGVYSDKELQSSVQVDFIANARAQQLAMEDFLTRGLNVTAQELVSLRQTAQRLAKRHKSVYSAKLSPELQLAYALKYIDYLKSGLDKDTVVQDFVKQMYGRPKEHGSGRTFNGTMTEERIAQVWVSFVSDAKEKWYPASKMLKLAFAEEQREIKDRLEFIGRGPSLDVTDKQPEAEY
ncbi:hypothetical protein [Pseudoalteromonas rubra]|uniref:hypothetical protein n=1 Tax=Pseudoalteromonas rubra TaxID=43658 RepID=UPI002DB657E5|nr:hypothetical protein [Pseudoalteromonas rubra]MEC4091614.1 hypothetical protein [Pseudoalteromonas rubra]